MIAPKRAATRLLTAQLGRFEIRCWCRLAGISWAILLIIIGCYSRPRIADRRYKALHICGRMFGESGASAGTALGQQG
jgi:hypothetical protein